MSLELALPLVAVLCAREDSVYRTLQNVEVYDRKRGAGTFRGDMPVIGHPPCRLFGKLAHMAKATEDEARREHALGVFVAGEVCRCGGVLEHPEGSTLWAEAGLPLPEDGETIMGFTLAVPQYWFGHLARKYTWLFFSGISPAELPDIPFRLEGLDRRGVEDLSKRQREATPLVMASWLVQCARRTMPYNFLRNVPAGSISKAGTTAQFAPLLAAGK